MIVWRGLGFLVPLISLGLMIAIQAAVNNYYNDPTFYSTHKWPPILACVVSAFVVAPLGFYLNRKPARTLIDEETGERFEFKADHSVFFIKFEYWSIALLIIALIIYFGK